MDPIGFPEEREEFPKDSLGFPSGFLRLPKAPNPQSFEGFVRRFPGPAGALLHLGARPPGEAPPPGPAKAAAHLARELSAMGPAASFHTPVCHPLCRPRSGAGKGVATLKSHF